MFRGIKPKQEKTAGKDMSKEGTTNIGKIEILLLE
jgi:hypothetical protein